MFNIHSSILFLTFFFQTIADKRQLFEMKFHETVNDNNSEKVPFFSDLQLKEFFIIIENLKNLKCSKDLNDTLRGVFNRQAWAVAMFDASVKIPVGIESGQVYQFGNFDECININNGIDDDQRPKIVHNNNYQESAIIKTKYCLADVAVDGLKIRSLASRKYHQLNTNSTIIHWGLCFPISCTSFDIETILGRILNHPVHIDEDKCYVKTDDLYATKGMIIYSCIIIGFIILTLFSTIFHGFMLCRTNPEKNHDKGCFEMIMKSFSAIENTKKLMQKSNDHLGLDVINGIKAISMIAIISGHALLFMVGGPVQNSKFYADNIKLVQNAFLVNSPLFVDTFLLLSGFLFCRILLRELERRRGKINVLILYTFRYIRLTPAYLAVIAFYITWLPRIGSGPLWNSRISLEQQRCEKSWWLNLLYVNNYFATENLCMFQSWYLSVDTQLFVMAPIVIHLLWKSRRLGVYLLTSLTLITSISPFLFTYFYEYDPTVLGFADEVTDISANETFKGVYIKTHMRTTAYVFGILTGFLLHYIEEKSIKIPKRISYLLWILATIVGTTSLMSITLFFLGPFTTLESSLYAGLHRFGWSFATSWIILASTTGNAGFLRKFLASRVFAPISRLTYCAYLTNGIVELYEVGSMRQPLYMSYVNLIGETFAHVGLTFVSALVLCLLFESPIHGIEKIFLQIDRKRQQHQLQEPVDNRTLSSSEEPA